MLSKRKPFKYLLRSVKLWRLLDIAAVAGNQRSQQRANVRKLEPVNARQLGGVAIKFQVGFATFVRER